MLCFGPELAHSQSANAEAITSSAINTWLVSITHSPERIRGESVLSAEIIWLGDRRKVDEPELAIDLLTAVDTAIRDLEEIARCWGSDLALERLLECQETLRAAYATS